MSAVLTDERRQVLLTRARMHVDRLLKESRAAWGGGWLMLSVDQRRNELVRRTMMEMALREDDPEVPAETVVYLLALARESLRVPL